jgi:hypothetical protein
MKVIDHPHSKERGYKVGYLNITYIRCFYDKIKMNWVYIFGKSIKDARKLLLVNRIYVK